jgi:Flp pilus assembly pilin Flp
LYFVFHPPEVSGTMRGAITRRTSESGQTTVEYAVVAGVLLASLAVLTLFLTTFQEYGVRILEMLAADYP